MARRAIVATLKPQDSRPRHGAVRSPPARIITSRLAIDAREPILSAMLPSSLKTRHRAVIVATATIGMCALAGCTEPAAAPRPVGGDIAALPAQLLFSATAVGDLADGRHIDCSIETIMNLTGEVTRGTAEDIRTGTGGGEAKRYKQLTNGNTLGFWAETGFADLRIAFIDVDSIEIRSPASANVTERFWREFARFTGNRRGSPGNPVIASGTWTCQPMDTPPSTGEYYDVEGSMPGTWVLTERGVAGRPHRP